MLSLSLSYSPVSDPFPRPPRTCFSPAVPLLYVRAILSSLSLLLRWRRYAFALSLRLLRVRIALRRAYSRSRSPALLDLLVCVRVSPSLGWAALYVIFRDARPGEASVQLYCRRGRLRTVRRSSARAN